MIELKKFGNLPIFVSDSIKAPHGFATRLGGVSLKDEYKSLNLGVRTDDNPAFVRKNYEIIKEALGIENLILSKQEHTDRVLAVSKEHIGTGEFGAEPFSFGVDGLVSDVQDIALGVFTADCTPILLHDPTKNVIGAVHSGWRGTVQKIVVNAVSLMIEKYGCKPADIEVATGPSIKGCCFEIGEDAAQLFRQSYGSFADKVLKPIGGGKYLADTDSCIKHDLTELNIQKIDMSNICSRCRNDLMFSHRAGDKGRQLSIIVNR